MVARVHMSGSGVLSNMDIRCPLSFRPSWVHVALSVGPPVGIFSQLGYRSH